MPRVPRYQQQARQGALPTPNVQVQTGGAFSAPGAALAEAGQAVQGVAQAADQAGQRIQAARDKAAATLLTEREAELERVVNERLYTGEGALMLTAGRAAAEREPEVLEEIEALRTKLADGLTGDAARAWNLRSNGRIQDIRRRTTGHVHQQLGVARESAARLHEQQGLVTVANVWSDAQALETQIVAMETAAAAAEDVPEARALRVAGVRAKANAMAIQAAVGAKNWEWAQQRLDLVGDALPPATRVQLQATVKTGLAGRAAETKASEIVTGSVDERTGWVDESRAFRALEGVPSEEREELRPRLIQRLQEAQRAEKAEIETVYSRAFTGYLQQGSRGIAPADRAWLETRAPATWRQLQQMQRADADRYRTNRERSDRSPETPEQRAVEADILADIKANPETWVGRPAQDVIEEAGRFGVTLTPQQVGRLGSALASEKGQAADAERKGGTVSNAEWRQRTESALDELGPRMKDKKKRNAAKAHLNQRRSEWINQNKGGVPPRNEVDRWMREAFTMVDDPRFLRGDKLAFELPPGITGAPLPADQQPYLPVRAELEPDATTILEPLDVSSTAEVGGFGLDVPAGNATTPQATVAREREAARQLLRTRGLPADDAAVDALLDRARQRAGGVTSGAGDQR